MNRILVFGTSGQVATELRRLAPVQALGRDTVDLANPSACAASIRFNRPTAVINAAAYTAVDRAETEEVLATTINGAAPAAMAEACAALHIPLVHISTDYVFDCGGTRPFAPNFATAPQNAYGRSKLAGEQGIRATGASHAILRTSSVFSAHGTNFVKTMLRLSDTHGELRVVDDQIGGPTPARSIAAACLETRSAAAGRSGEIGLPIILPALPMSVGATLLALYSKRQAARRAFRAYRRANIQRLPRDRSIRGWIAASHIPRLASPAWIGVRGRPTH